MLAISLWQSAPSQGAAAGQKRPRTAQPFTGTVIDLSSSSDGETGPPPQPSSSQRTLKKRIRSSSTARTSSPASIVDLTLSRTPSPAPATQSGTPWRPASQAILNRCDHDSDDDYLDGKLPQSQRKVKPRPSAARLTSAEIAARDQRLYKEGAARRASLNASQGLRQEQELGRRDQWENELSVEHERPDLPDTALGGWRTISPEVQPHPPVEIEQRERSESVEYYREDPGDFGAGDFGADDFDDKPAAEAGPAFRLSARAAWGFVEDTEDLEMADETEDASMETELAVRHPARSYDDEVDELEDSEDERTNLAAQLAPGSVLLSTAASAAVQLSPACGKEVARWPASSGPIPDVLRGQLDGSEARQQIDRGDSVPSYGSPKASPSPGEEATAVSQLTPHQTIDIDRRTAPEDFAAINASPPRERSPSPARDSSTSPLPLLPPTRSSISIPRGPARVASLPPQVSFDLLAMMEEPKAEDEQVIGPSDAAMSSLSSSRAGSASTVQSASSKSSTSITIPSSSSASDSKSPAVAAAIQAQLQAVVPPAISPSTNAQLGSYVMQSISSVEIAPMAIVNPFILRVQQELERRRLQQGSLPVTAAIPIKPSFVTLPQSTLLDVESSSEEPSSIRNAEPMTTQTNRLSPANKSPELVEPQTLVPDSRVDRVSESHDEIREPAKAAQPKEPERRPQTTRLETPPPYPQRQPRSSLRKLPFFAYDSDVVEETESEEEWGPETDSDDPIRPLVRLGYECGRSDDEVMVIDEDEDLTPAPSMGPPLSMQRRRGTLAKASRSLVDHARLD